MLQGVVLISQTNTDSHFNYHYTVCPDGDKPFSKTWVRDYTKRLRECYGEPGKSWGYRIDKNFGGIAVHFHNEEDSTWFKMMAK